MSLLIKATMSATEKTAPEEVETAEVKLLSSAVDVKPLKSTEYYPDERGT